MTYFKDLFSKLIGNKILKKRGKRILTGAAGVVVFITIYCLILPAVAVDKDSTDEVAGMYLESTESAAELIAGENTDAAAVADDGSVLMMASDAEPENDADAAAPYAEETLQDISEAATDVPADDAEADGSVVYEEEVWDTAAADADYDGSAVEEAEELSDEEPEIADSEQDGQEEPALVSDDGEVWEDPENSYTGEVITEEITDELITEDTDFEDASVESITDENGSDSAFSETGEPVEEVPDETTEELWDAGEPDSREMQGEQTEEAPEGTGETETNAGAVELSAICNDILLKVSADEAAGIPDGAVMYFSEYDPTNPDEAEFYQYYTGLAGQTVSETEADWSPGGARVFAVRFEDPDGYGVQPSVPVTAQIEFPEIDPVHCGRMEVVRFAFDENGTEGGVLIPSVSERDMNGDVMTCSFETGELSIFCLLWNDADLYYESEDNTESITDGNTETAVEFPVQADDENDLQNITEVDDEQEAAAGELAAADDTAEDEKSDAGEASEGGKTETDAAEASEDEQAETDDAEASEDEQAETDSAEASDDEKAETDAVEASDDEKTENDAADASDDEKAVADSAKAAEDEKTDTSGEEKASADMEPASDQNAAAFPAQTFSERTETVKVQVYAGAGAFPAGTTMTVEEVEDEDTISTITDFVEKDVTRVHAVNITFFDAEGNEIEPLKEIRVVMSAEESEKTEEIQVVHVDNDGNAESVENVKLTERNGVARAQIVEQGNGSAEEEANAAESSADAEVFDEDTASNQAESADAGEVTTPETVAEDIAEEIPEEIAEASTDEAEEVAEASTDEPEEIAEAPVAESAEVTEVPVDESAEAVETLADEYAEIGDEPIEDISYTDTQEIGEPETVGVEFAADEFSVYALVYTVDFHWQANGNSYEFSIPGGGFVSFYDLVKVLGIEADDANTEEDEIQKLLDGIESIVFSNPELVSVSKVEEDSTVGSIKELLGLECEYSAELTEEQIEEINEKEAKAGDWVLISLLPFDTEESLTVTMKNGDQFVIRVTDAQTRNTVIDVAGRHGVTNTENVKVYSGHNLIFNTQIDTIEAAGTRVTLLGMESGSLNMSSWYQITYVKNGEPVTGYVETKYIDLLEMAAPVASENDAFKVTASWEEGVLPEGTTLESGVPSLTEEKRKELENRALSILPVSPGKTLKVTGIHFFDLSFMADGEEIEPNGEVNVSMELKQTVPTEENEGLHLVHFVGEAAELLEKTDFIKDENGDLSALDFTVGSFSTFAVVKTIETTVVASNGETYEVTVYYTDDANIPDGSTLSVTEFSEDSEEYDYARKAVLADKKARGEWVDLSSFGLAAVDISILNPDGEEIEPEVPVYVDIRIKNLPGVENLDEVKDSLAIQHHVEVEDGVVIETVFDGSLDPKFVLQTDETIIEEGTTVDPSSISDDAFTIPNIDKDSMIDLGEPPNDGDTISFATPVFSVFTLTWKANRVNINNTVSLSWKSGTGRNATTYGTVRIHYYDTDYNPIQPPVSDQTVTQPQTISLTSGNYVNIPGYTFSGAWVYYDQQAGTGWNLDEVGVRFYNYNYYGTTYRYTLIQHGGENYKSGYYQNNQAYTEDVYLYFENTSTQTQSGRVHYGYMNGSTFVEFPEGTPSYTPTYSNQYQKYLIYDIDGYQYSYAYRNSTTSRIAPYISVSGSYYDTAGSYLGQLSNNDDVYLVYEPNPSTTQGGKPKLKEVSADDKPDVPDITKSSVVNGDGTNTLSLSVTGYTKQREVEKLADVIVIFDVSGSMKQNIDNNEDAADGVNDTNSRMYQLKHAVDTMADTLLSDKYKNSLGEPLIRMSLISFSNIAQTTGNGFTEDADTFKSWVSGLGADGGTNWEAALKLANTIAVDPERATFVIFVTDGEPTFRYTRGEYSDSELIYPASNSEYDVTDYYRIYNVFGGGNQDLYGENYAAALVQARSIVGNKKNLFTIGIGPEVSSLENFGSEAGAGGNYTATSSSALEGAFDDITAKIVAMMGYSDIKISDGITALTQTVQKSSLVNFAEDDFTYYKRHDYDIATQKDVDEHRASAVGEKIQVNGDWETWDPTSEGCAEAAYNTATGAVEWDMGEGFMLEEGYTYQVRFKVWPSQEAYDLLADLNNGKKSYSSLSDAEKAQISEPTEAGGIYTLKTNSDTSYTYREATKTGDTVTPTGEPSEPGSFPDVDPLELTTKPLKIKKQWHNNYVDSRVLTDHITMELYGVDSDGTTSHDFKTITLTKEGGWYAENNYISYGLVTYNTATNAGAKVYENGHDFTLRETDDEAHYYELSAGIYRPMYINGTPTILEKVDAAPRGMSDSVFHYSDGSYHYYRLDGKIYRDTTSDTLLIATNTHRSYMDLKKIVVDESGVAAVDDEEFEYKITFTVPDSIDNYDTVEKYIWFSVYDSVARRTLAPSEYTKTGVITPAQENADLYSGSEYANYLVATSGQEVTLKIKQGWNVRFLNLPIGTTYSFEEINIPKGYSFVKAEVSGTRWIANMVDGTDMGSAQAMSSLPANTSGNNSNTAISGTINFANARYNTTYTNKTLTQKVNILKTSQDGTTALPGAVFSLYTENGYAADPKETTKTDLTSDGNGGIELGVLALGKYYLVETNAPAGYIPLSEPIIITVADTGVTYNQNNSLSLSNGGVNYDEETKTYTLTVTNNAGIELPSTGGPGTRLFTILGSIMLLGAGLLLWRRQWLV